MLHEYCQNYLLIPRTLPFPDVVGEEPLVPRVMHITDGNYSYKHAANAGLIDNHIFKSDYLISWEQVHLFQYEVKGWVKEWSVDAEIEHECKEDNAMGDLSQEGPNNPSDSADGEVVESFCTRKAECFGHIWHQWWLTHCLLSWLHWSFLWNCV